MQTAHDLWRQAADVIFVAMLVEYDVLSSQPTLAAVAWP